MLADPGIRHKIFLPAGCRPVANRAEGDVVIMVEKKIELRRRRTRGKKLAKLKIKLAAAKDSREKETILNKIHIVSPWWTEPKGEPKGEPRAAPKPAAKAEPKTKKQPASS